MTKARCGKGVPGFVWHTVRRNSCYSHATSVALPLSLCVLAAFRYVQTVCFDTPIAAAISAWVRPGRAAGAVPPPWPRSSSGWRRQHPGDQRTTTSPILHEPCNHAYGTGVHHSGRSRWFMAEHFKHRVGGSITVTCSLPSRATGPPASACLGRAGGRVRPAG